MTAVISNSVLIVLVLGLLDCAVGNRALILILAHARIALRRRLSCVPLIHMLYETRFTVCPAVAMAHTVPAAARPPCSHTVTHLDTGPTWIKVYPALFVY